MEPVPNVISYAADKFCEPVFFFMVANYVVANGLAVTGLDRRITVKLLPVFVRSFLLQP